MLFLPILPMTLGATLLAPTVSGQYSPHFPEPPNPEPIDVVELPLPPVVSSSATGACTSKINPRGTGCIGRDAGEEQQFQSGDFTPDGRHIVVNVDFIGAPAAPDPASIYYGEHLILISTDGTNFSNGDPWKCITCGVPSKNAPWVDPQKDYPHVFRSGDKALWGHNIVSCGGNPLASDACTPNITHIHPIHWTISADGTGKGGSPREMRLHPDDQHMGWSSFTGTGGQFTYFGRLEFNEDPKVGDPLVPRYDLVDVNILVDANGKPPMYVDDDKLRINHGAITPGELRGFSGSGDEIIYIGSPVEANNIDVSAVHLTTGAVRRLTSHPDYTDPVSMSQDDQWIVAMDTRVVGRQMFMSGMRWIPPIIDYLVVALASSTRNNGPRRFFQPILIGRDGDSGNHFGQQVNADGDGSDGSANDPNWNGRADPAFSPDSTMIVYWQALVVSPSCGGANPLPCPVSTAQGGRNYRIMLARRTSLKPSKPAPVFKAPDFIPWAKPFPTGSKTPAQYEIPAGNYTLQGQLSGAAEVSFIEDPETGIIRTISASYSDYSDQEGYVIDGYEKVSKWKLLPNVWKDRVEWFSNITQTGVVEGIKVTSRDGYELEIDVSVNLLESNGTLTTVLDGIEYVQPASGT
ncbi:hypothetical protein FVEN_g57 [Fusarium venenatum]|uniref:Saponin hydrolase n=1 Tax=Fusarium venenatum TaxID=56646 RepID=A0A2L2T6N0_9HYPO|nr:uncharacterized protein FVRRES_07859 [Fusarium venenatum]KAG8362133.1 hypothetical protein FVEN_g57 [Fusarium venenatum]KAH6994746.1 hypothetical protein EDB82DRAFT_462594 [Fusarium venenatum]CEI63423.1 unnamed protein product [Fusarium venenatum]